MIYRGSRYQKAKVELIDGIPTIVSRYRPWTTPRPDDTFHTVAYGERLDQIAYRYYGDAELWWVVADINGILDPLADLPVGKVLRVPNYRTVIEEVLAS